MIFCQHGVAIMDDKPLLWPSYQTFYQSAQSLHCHVRKLERSASMYGDKTRGPLTAIQRVRHHYCHSDPEYHSNYPANSSSNQQKMPAIICSFCKWVKWLTCLIRHTALHLECTQIQEQMNLLIRLHLYAGNR